MSAAFTPGPWVKDRHDQLFGIDGKQVCVWNAGIAFSSRDEETEANARLIASAPEMFDALVAVNKCGNGGAKLSRVASDMTRRALAKARGEA
jgi:hypothetical protein